MNIQPRPTAPGSLRPAFSLTEVLVVTAIIAVLCAIALPVFGTMQNRAKRSQCSANLKQLGQAFHMYAADNGNILLATTNNDTRIKSGSSWSIMLMNYLDVKFPGMNEESLFLCPAARDTYPNGNAKRTYAMNYQNLPTPGSGVHPTRGWGQKTRMSWHTHPAQTALLIDSKGSVTPAGDGAMNFTLKNFDQFADWRHSDGMNVLFLDGHVEWMAESESEQLKEYINHFAQ